MDDSFSLNWIFVCTLWKVLSLTAQANVGKQSCTCYKPCFPRTRIIYFTAAHVLQECEGEGNLRQAEQYYVESGDWKAAVNMYRSQDMWDEAHRVSTSGQRVHGIDVENGTANTLSQEFVPCCGIYDTGSCFIKMC